MHANSLLDAVLGLHMLGIALGFGLGIFADILVMRALARPVDARNLTSLRRLNHAVVGGIALTWITGLMLLHLDPGTTTLSPQLVLKIGLVALLTLNAFAAGEIALPALAEARGRAFADMALSARLRLGLCAGLSAAGWSTALCLAIFAYAGAYAFTELSDMLFYVASVGTGTAACIALVTPVLVLVQRRQMQAEALRRGRFLDHRAHRSLRA